MKKNILFVLLAFIALASDNPAKLVKKPVPSFSGKSICGTPIDSAFFKGKVTLVNFFYVGCVPCMKEIPHLQKMAKELPADQFQLLGIAPHTQQQLKDFNSDNGSEYSKARKFYKLDSLAYLIFPECGQEKPDKKPGYLGPECYVISKLFRINSYPQSFIVDKKGIIRKFINGFAPDQAEEFTAYIKSEIEELLKE